MKNNLKQALEKLALGHAEGIVSADKLVKACESYKMKDEDFLDSLDYHIQVSKSIFDYLHKENQDEEISKAILPGQTKVVDGTTYIYTATPNAKTPYDWRVMGNGTPNQILPSRAVLRTDYVNGLFPSDLKGLKEIKTLGGSTGAKLMEDATGNQYVMKRGSNTNNEHVKSEYLANQMYQIMGCRVPDFELYEENGEHVLLSKFIPMTTNLNSVDYKESANQFIADAMMANWDVYCNDNILKDSAGRLIRVDNGGSLSFKAQGGKKPNFNGNVTDVASMIKYNPSVLSHLSPAEIIQQIDDIMPKEAAIVQFLRASNENALAQTYEFRFKDLARIKKEYEGTQAAKNRTVLPRTLLAPADMYREFDDDELEEIWNGTSGKDYASKVTNKNSLGWELLGDICKRRGFDARPEVVDDNTYWDAVKKNDKQLFRGLGSHNISAEEYVEDFKYNDNCYYGKIGLFGAGIYFHVNDGSDKSRNPTDYKNSSAWGHTKQYSKNDQSVIYGVLKDDAKVATVQDIMKEVLDLSPKGNSPEVKAKKAELDDLKKQLAAQTSSLSIVTQVIVDDVHTKMHWDEFVLSDHQIIIDNEDWGAVDDKGNPLFDNFDHFFHGNVENWVKANGGTVTEKAPNSDVYILKMPNSRTEFMFTRYQYENNGVKQKNQFTKAYHFHVNNFKDWLYNNHYKVINAATEKALESLGDKTAAIQDEIKITRKAVADKDAEISSLNSSKDPNADIVSGIYEYTKSWDKEALGAYAAIKGYDAMIQDHGNGMSNSFLIVFNRSKIIVKK